MRAIHEMEIIQIDVTNACIRSCSNCTRFCGHHEKPFFMEMETFRQAVDSLIDFPGMVGMIGGEPLLHPDFEEMALYMAKRLPDRARRGLWSTVPRSKVKHAEVINEVFGHLNLNDHSVDTILHQPILVAAEEIIEDESEMWAMIDNCWVQMMWSASITPRGAFFCEVAASMSQLFDGPRGWPVEPGWWKREPADFKEQKEQWCPKCGCSVPLARRVSTEEVDDVSPGNLLRLLDSDSPKVRKQRYQIHDGGLVESWSPGVNWYMSGVEQETEYRERIAKRINRSSESTIRTLGGSDK